MRFSNRWKLYEFIDKNEYLTGSEISERMSWNVKKVMRGVRRLIKDGVVKEEDGIFFPTPWQEMIDWDEFSMEGKRY